MSEAHNELTVYAMHRPGFLLQHVVDAWGAQTANAASKPIGIVFALAGLYLRVEKAYDGRSVQRMHQRMAAARRTWPRLSMPQHRGALTVEDVMAAPEGPARDRAIDSWCASVWEAWHDSQPWIRELMREFGVVGQ